MKSQAKSEKHGRVVDVNPLWESAATISMITNDAARKLGLRGQPASNYCESWWHKRAYLII